jgi:Predicted hydrolase (HAD superfamily)
MIPYDKIKVIAFDADDTLWSNEPYYRDAEKEYINILDRYFAPDEISKELYQTEMSNMSDLGYGAKAFTISMIQTAIKLKRKYIGTEQVDFILSDDMLLRFIEIGRNLLTISVEPLPDVNETLHKLRGSGKYKLILATKGEQRDQLGKLKRSKLSPFFDHVEIMLDKTEEEYLRLMKIVGAEPSEFVMVGNSFKSDIKPVLAVGGYGIHIPYEIMWQHEITELFEHEHLVTLNRFNELLKQFGIFQ